MVLGNHKIMERQLQSLTFGAREALAKLLIPDESGSSVKFLEGLIGTPNEPFLLCVPAVTNALVVMSLFPLSQLNPAHPLHTVLSSARVLVRADSYARCAIGRICREARDESLTPVDRATWPYYPRFMDLGVIRAPSRITMMRIATRSVPFKMVDRVCLPSNPIDGELQRLFASSGFDAILVPAGTGWVAFNELRAPLRVFSVVSCQAMDDHDMQMLCKIPTLRELRISNPATMCPLTPLAGTLVETLVVNAFTAFADGRDLDYGRSPALSLRHVEFRGPATGVADTIWGLLAAFAPNVEFLAVENFARVRGRGVSALHRCPKLHTLSVARCSFEAENLAGINALLALKSLAVEGTWIVKEADIRNALRDHPSLREVTHSCAALPKDSGLGAGLFENALHLVRVKIERGAASTLSVRTITARPSLKSAFAD